MRDSIIDYIRRNRISTTEVADALGKTGSLPDVRAINRGHFRVGKIFWAYAFGETNWHVHEQVQRVQEGDIVLVENFECGDRAIFGDLVSKYLLLYRQASAVVVRGALRDSHRLIKENWPIWCRGFNPVGCFNSPKEVSIPSENLEEKRAHYDGAIAVCDDTGVVIVPKHQHNQEFLRRLEQIEELEDKWYECVDRLKWSTFETVCLRKYESSPRLPEKE
jgi:4-hydroxy-4-methyl-2-oxoglutarate aldolase